MGDDDSLNFEQDPQFAHLPPLDKMRKVRREVIKTCNDYRAKFGHQSVYTDTFTNLFRNDRFYFLIHIKTIFAIKMSNHEPLFLKPTRAS